jgi:hypothetical protein
VEGQGAEGGVKKTPGDPIITAISSINNTAPNVAPFFIVID